MWIYIMIGVLLGVGLMTVAAIVFVMYKQKKGCWKRAAGNKTMPIGFNASFKKDSDIEFAGATEE